MSSTKAKLRVNSNKSVEVCSYYADPRLKIPLNFRIANSSLNDCPPPVDAYVTYPTDRSTKRAVLLLTDVIGHRFINAQLIADQLAANGYFVVMPDLFHGDPVPLNRPANWDLMAWLNGPPGHLLPRVEPVVKAVLGEMKSGFGCERIGAIGYCFGVGCPLGGYSS